MFTDNWRLGSSVNEGRLLERFIHSLETMLVIIIILLVFRQLSISIKMTSYINCIDSNLTLNE